MKTTIGKVRHATAEQETPNLEYVQTVAGHIRGQGRVREKWGGVRTFV